MFVFAVPHPCRRLDRPCLTAHGAGRDGRYHGRGKYVGSQRGSDEYDGEWRFDTWDAALEALPVAQLPPRPVKNTWDWNLLTQRGPFFFSRPPPLI